MTGGHLRRDLFRAATRSAVLFVIALTIALIGSGGQLRLRQLTTVIAVALIPFPLSLLEFLRGRLPPQRRGGVVILIWGVAVIVLVLFAVQLIYWDAGGLAGIDSAWTRSQRILQPEALLAFGVFAALLTLVSVGRVPEEAAPVIASLKWSAGIGLVLVPFGGCGALVSVVMAVGLLGGIYSAGDWVEARLWALLHHGEAEAMRKLGLPMSKLWLLAYLNHQPARSALGARAPTPSADLKTWIKTIGTGGPDARHRVALALVQLVVPLWQDGHPGESLAEVFAARIEAHVATPTDETAAAAREAMQAWQGQGWEASVGVEALRSLLASARWGSTPSSEANLQAARIVDTNCGSGTARSTISEALVAWALDGAPEPGVEPSGPERGSETDPAPPNA